MKDAKRADQNTGYLGFKKQGYTHQARNVTRRDK